MVFTVPCLGDVAPVRRLFSVNRLTSISTLVTLLLTVKQFTLPLSSSRLIRYGLPFQLSVYALRQTFEELLVPLLCSTRFS